MAGFIAPTTDPLIGQFLPKRGKRRSWEKGIVWNPRKQSLHIQKIADIEKGIDFTNLQEFHGYARLTHWLA
jgi:hypothetical protein